MTPSNFIKQNTLVAGSVIGTLGITFGLLALATDPVTLNQVTTSGVSLIVSTYSAFLVANLLTIITAVVSISLVFTLIKLALRWINRYTNLGEYSADDDEGDRRYFESLK